jgi:hypothetical protein
VLRAVGPEVAAGVGAGGDLTGEVRGERDRRAGHGGDQERQNGQNEDDGSELHRGLLAADGWDGRIRSLIRDCRCAVGY